MPPLMCICSVETMLQAQLMVQDFPQLLSQMGASVNTKSKLKAKFKPSMGKATLQGKADGQDQAQPQELASSSGVGSRSGHV